MPSLIQYKFHESPSISYLVMVEDRKKSLNFRQSKGNNFAISDDTTIKLLHAYSHIRHIYIQYKFHDIPSIGNLVMAEDRKTIEFLAIKGQ